ncbi:hypothetical protein [Jonesia quinghaiensis]|uniref:hypothetical protein n=1 Tax=Jonesia quinghaiensis TaxID=262806 RepID=UPI0004084E56|nr:hypothetical protein [Jonesia quinghaiensis]
MAKIKLGPGPHAHWDRPVAILVLAVLTVILMRGKADAGLYAVLIFACAIAVFLIVQERRKVSKYRRHVKRWQELASNSTRIKARELKNRLAAAAQFGVATRHGTPLVTRWTYKPDTRQMLVELFSLNPEHQRNDVFLIKESSLAALIEELHFRVIESPTLCAQVETEYFDSFVPPLRVKEQELFNNALQAVRGTWPTGPWRRKHGRINMAAGAVGLGLLALTLPDAFSPGVEWAVYVFVLCGVVLVGFAVRFGITVQDTAVSYCNGLRKQTWQLAEIDSVAVRYRETFGFLGERGGFHPVLVLNNGEQKDLALFAYSRRDSARTYVQLDQLCANGARQNTLPKELPSYDA